MISFDGKEYSLASPEKNQKQSVINVSANSKIILVCPGIGNEISAVHQESLITTCNRQNELQIAIGSKTITGTDKFFCKKPITPQVINTGQTCGENSQWIIYEIGYSVNWKTNFYQTH